MKTKHLLLSTAITGLIITTSLLPSCKPDEKQCDTAMQDSLKMREMRLQEREMALREREMAVAEKEQSLGIHSSSGYSGDAASGSKTGSEEEGRRTVKGGRKNYDLQDPKAAYKKPVLDNPGQFPESSERVITEDDLTHKSAFGKRVMLNEIYARHGYIFTEADMKKHFNGESWYKGTEKNMAKLKLTPTEIQNVTFIKSHSDDGR